MQRQELSYRSTTPTREPEPVFCTAGASLRLVKGAKVFQEMGILSKRQFNSKSLQFTLTTGNTF